MPNAIWLCSVDLVAQSWASTVYQLGNGCFAWQFDNGNPELPVRTAMYMSDDSKISPY